MTYGQWLDDAGAALRRAAALARRPVAITHAQAATVLHQRDRAVGALIRLASLLQPATPRARPSRTRALPDALPDHAALLLPALEHARAPARMVPAPPEIPALADELASAAQSLHVAADILVSHIDPTNGARTLEGAAIRLGASRTDAFAELARLATGVTAVDTCLIGCLGGDDLLPPSPAAGHTVALVLIKEWLGSPERTALTTIADSSDQPSLLRHLSVATATSNAVTARSPRTVVDCAAIVEDLGAWLFRAPDLVEGHHLAAATRLGQLAAVMASEQFHSGSLASALVGWRTAALAAGNLAAAPPADPGARFVEVEHAAYFLRSTTFDLASLAPLMQRLPGLAAALRAATVRAVHRGVILTRNASLQANPNAPAFTTPSSPGPVRFHPTRRSPSSSEDSPARRPIGRTMVTGPSRRVPVVRFSRWRVSRRKPGRCRRPTTVRHRHPSGVAAPEMGDGSSRLKDNDAPHCAQRLGSVGERGAEIGALIV